MLRDGPIAGHRRSFRWFHVAALAAAFAAILFVASGIPLWHNDAPGTEANCPICHVAHMPALPGMATSIVSAPKVVAWVAPPKELAPHAAPAGLASPPRAPPA